jgi:hypothetical protein
MIVPCFWHCSAMLATLIYLDLPKSVFQAHGVHAHGKLW